MFNFERNDKGDGAPSERLLRLWAEARAMPSVESGGHHQECFVSPA